jgi:uncharacterized membrane protein YjfL (UPF0719 family)
LTEFSDDETLAFLACAIASTIAGVLYYLPIIRITFMAGGALIRLLLALAPPLCLLLLLPVLQNLTSHEVREDDAYVLLFILGGGVWLAIAVGITHILGISLRDDAIERHNPAAALALCGAMLGLTCAYAGANVGEGATIWMTFGPAVLATIVWVAAWGVFQLLTGASDTIAIDRDVASAIRLAGLFVALGLILGRAVAGDYESEERTLHDLVAQGWPVLPLTLAAAVVQIRARPRPGRPQAPGSRALLAAAIYLAISAIWILLLGAPRIGGAK